MTPPTACRYSAQDASARPPRTSGSALVVPLLAAQHPQHQRAHPRADRARRRARRARRAASAPAGPCRSPRAPRCPARSCSSTARPSRCGSSVMRSGRSSTRLRRRQRREAAQILHAPALAPHHAIALAPTGSYCDDQLPLLRPFQVVEQPARAPQLEPEAERDRKSAAHEIAHVGVAEQARRRHDRRRRPRLGHARRRAARAAARAAARSTRTRSAQREQRSTRARRCTR